MGETHPINLIKKFELWPVFAYIPPPRENSMAKSRLVETAVFASSIIVPSIIPNEKPAVASKVKIVVH